MEAGPHIQNLAIYGKPMMLVLSGSPMQMEGGNGQIRDGYGYPTNHGDGQLIITADGYLMIIRDGYGFQVQHGRRPG